MDPLSCASIPSAPPLISKLKRLRSESVEIISPPRLLRPRKEESGDLKRELGLLPDVVRVGSCFKTLEDARQAVFAQEEALGHKWITKQTKKKNDRVVRVTLRCNRYSNPIPQHLLAIDPSDHRHGRSVRIGCDAHVNVCQPVAGGWHVTVTNFKHNHAPLVPPGGSITRRPTKEQRAIIADLARVSKIT